MLKKLTHITILVKDQDQALKFYTEKLGFKVHTDANFENMRWLTVHPEEQKDMEFCLLLPTTQEGLAQVGKQGDTYGIGCLNTDDAHAEYARLKAAGVDMLSEPKTESWGTGFGFKDLYGNHFYVNEEPK